MIKFFKCAPYIRNCAAKFVRNDIKYYSKLASEFHIKPFNLLTSEYSATVYLLQRSLEKHIKRINGNSELLLRFINRRLNSSRLFCSNPPKNQDNKPNKPSDNNDGKNDKNKNNNDDEKLKAIATKLTVWILTFYIVSTILTILFTGRSGDRDTTTRYISWNEFVHHMLAKGEVKEIIIRPDLEMVTIILHEGAIVKGRRVQSNVFHMSIVDATKFEEKLRNVEKQLGITESIPITYDRRSDVTGRLLTLLIIFTVVMMIVSRLKGIKSPLSMDAFSQMTRAKFTLVDPFEGGKGVLFKDVAGLKEAKQEVIEFIDYLKTPEKYQKLGAKVPRGALLLGPPGCGKTLLAKAVATEAQVPFLSMNGSEFIEMIGGLGAARVRDLFKEGKKRAPCIIYIDEIDAIGRHRSGVGNINQMSSGESEQTLNQLLVEMDGMSTKSGVLMLASTNRADILDKALLRPGRFDRHILIDLPTFQERQEIFEKHLEPIVLEDEPKIFSERMARLTPGFSGADIANVCNEAALHAARFSQKVVKAADLEYAVERLVGGTEKRSHALSLLERRTIAYHESGHALVGWMLKNSDILLKVTIVPRTSLALGFAQYTPTERKLYSKEDLFDKMCMALGGRAAENITFNQITSGAQNDLEKVTKMAYAQIKYFGMNDLIGPMHINDEEPSKTAYKPYSNHLANVIDIEARQLVEKAYEMTEKILKDNEPKLIKLAEELLNRETLNYDDVVKLIGPPAFDPKGRKTEPVEFEQSLKNISN